MAEVKHKAWVREVLFWLFVSVSVWLIYEMSPLIAN